MGSGSSVAAGSVVAGPSLHRERERFLIHVFAHNKPRLLAETTSQRRQAQTGVLTSLLQQHLQAAEQVQPGYVTAHALLASFRACGLMVDPTRLADLLWALASLQHPTDPSQQDDHQDGGSSGIVDRVHFYYPWLLQMLDGGDGGMTPPLPGPDLPLVKRGVLLHGAKSREVLLPVVLGKEEGPGASPMEASSSFRWRLVQVERLLRAGGAGGEEKEGGSWRGEALAHVQACLDMLPLEPPYDAAASRSSSSTSTAAATHHPPPSSGLSDGPAPAASIHPPPLAAFSSPSSSSSIIKEASVLQQTGPDAFGAITAPAPVDIWNAAKRGDLAMLMGVEGYEEEDWHMKDDKDNTALYYACLCGQLEVCDFLIRKMGGLGAIPKDDLLRDRTNALTGDIRDLLDGIKVLEEIQITRLQRRDSQIRKEREREEEGEGLVEDGELLYAAMCIFDLGEEEE